MPDPQPLPALGDVVDVGSWARFSPSLAIFLDEQVRSRSLPGGPGDGLTVLLTAPAPVAVKEEPAAGGLRSLWRGRPRRALSPEVPGVALTGGRDGVELDLSVLDDAGRILLDADARTRLTAMGWQRRRQTLVRVLPDGGVGGRSGHPSAHRGTRRRSPGGSRLASDAARLRTRAEEAVHRLSHEGLVADRVRQRVGGNRVGRCDGLVPGGLPVRIRQGVRRHPGGVCNTRSGRGGPVRPAGVVR